jgi:hypothetical protein
VLNSPPAAAENEAGRPLLPIGFDIGSPEDQLALFSPEPIFPTGEGLLTSPESRAPPVNESGMPENQTAPLHAPTAHQPTPSDRLLSDGEIASMKKRLKLSARQQRFWPNVEGALRGILWTQGKSGQLRIIDPNSRGMHNLRPAAAPLMASLNEEQKLEFRRLAGLVGLQELIVQD